MPEFPDIDLDATLSNVYETLDASDDGEEYAEPATEEAEEVTEAAPTEETQEAAPTEDQSDEPTGDEPAVDDSLAPAFTPPARWSADDKAEFDALPPEAQSLVLKRERDIESHLQKRTQEISSKAQMYESLEQVLEPRRAQLRAEYGSEAAAMNELLNLSDFAVSNPPAFIAQFARAHNIDLGDMSGASEDTDGYQQSYQPQDVERLVAQKVQQALGQAQAQQGQSALLSQVEAFRNEVNDKGEPAHPHFETVRMHMAGLAQANPEMSLADCYESAVWSNPATRHELINAQAQERMTAAKAKAAAAEKAASTRPRGTNGQFVASSAATPEDTMARVFDEMNG